MANPSSPDSNDATGKDFGYIREISVRYTRKRVEGKEVAHATLTGPEKVHALFKHLEDETKEKLIAIAVDTKHKLICYELVALGSLNSVYLRPAEVLRVGVLVNAFALIVVHNHPSGDPSPSENDKSFTQRLNRSCKDMGIELLDHVIIGSDTFFSFAEKGLLDESGA